MSVFSEYIKNTMQQKQPQQPYIAGTVQPQQTVTPQPQQPVVDPNNAIGSLAELLGPTPAEREAQERRMLESKSKMQMWTGLFDGLRQLGNLYYTTKGATPQQYTDNPVGQVEQQYQQYRALNDSMANYRRNYAQSLYSLQRQMEQDKMAKEKHQADLDYYKNRDEMNARKMELAEFKAQTDADYKKATLEQKNAINEVRIRLLEGQISKTEAERQYKLIMAGNAQRGTETTVTKPDGSVTTTVRKPAGKRKNRKGNNVQTSSLNYDNTKALGL